MRIVAIIPARLQSTRLANKVLLDLAGKPMIQWVIESLQRNEGIHSVCVATDNEKIQGLSNDLNVKGIMTSSLHICGTDRIIEAADQVGDFDYVINFQADEPLLETRHIAPIIKALEAKPEILTAHFINRSAADFSDPNSVKLVQKANKEVMYFSRAGIPFDRNANANFPGSFKNHVGIYAFSKEALKKIKQLEPSINEKTESLEQLRWLDAGISISSVEIPGDLIGVDTQADLEKASRILQDRIKN